MDGTVAPVGSAAVRRSRVLLGITKHCNGVVQAGSCALSIDAPAKSAVPHIESIWVDRATFAPRGGGVLLDAVAVAVDGADCFSIGRRGAVAFESLLRILLLGGCCSSWRDGGKLQQERKSEGGSNDKTTHCSVRIHVGEYREIEHSNKINTML